MKATVLGGSPIQCESRPTQKARLGHLLRFCQTWTKDELETATLMNVYGAGRGLAGTINTQAERKIQTNNANRHFYLPRWRNDAASSICRKQQQQITTKRGQNTIATKSRLIGLETKLPRGALLMMDEDIRTLLLNVGYSIDNSRLQRNFVRCIVFRFWCRAP